MKRLFTIAVLLAVFVCTTAFLQDDEFTIAQLRELYSGDPSYWPKPNVGRSA